MNWGSHWVARISHSPRCNTATKTSTSRGGCAGRHSAANYARKVVKLQTQPQTQSPAPRTAQSCEIMRERENPKANNPKPSPNQAHAQPQKGRHRHTLRNARGEIGEPPSPCQTQSQAQAQKGLHRHTLKKTRGEMVTPQAHAKTSPKLMPKPDRNQPQAGVTADDAGHQAQAQKGWHRHTLRNARGEIGEPPSSCQTQPQAEVTANDAGHDLCDILAVHKAELVLDRVAGQLDRHAVLAAPKDPHHVARPPVGQVLEFEFPGIRIPGSGQAIGLQSSRG